MEFFITAVIFLSLAVYINISFKSLALNRSKSYLGILDRLGDRYKIIAATPVLIIIGLILLLSIFGKIQSAQLFMRGHGESNALITLLLLFTLCIYLMTDSSVRQRKNTLEHSQAIIDPPKIYKQAKLFTNINGIALISFGSICTWFIFLKAFA